MSTGHFGRSIEPVHGVHMQTGLYSWPAAGDSLSRSRGRRQAWFVVVTNRPWRVTRRQGQTAEEDARPRRNCSRTTRNGPENIAESILGETTSAVLRFGNGGPALPLWKWSSTATSCTSAAR